MIACLPQVTHTHLVFCSKHVFSSLPYLTHIISNPSILQTLLTFNLWSPGAQNGSLTTLQNGSFTTIRITYYHQDHLPQCQLDHKKITCHPGTQECLEMACNLLGLGAVAVAKVLKFREMHVNRQGRTSIIKCPRCGAFSCERGGGQKKMGSRKIFTVGLFGSKCDDCDFGNNSSKVYRRLTCVSLNDFSDFATANAVAEWLAARQDLGASPANASLHHQDSLQTMLSCHGNVACTCCEKTE